MECWIQNTQTLNRKSKRGMALKEFLARENMALLHTGTAYGADRENSDEWHLFNDYSHVSLLLGDFHFHGSAFPLEKQTDAAVIDVKVANPELRNSVRQVRTV